MPTIALEREREREREWLIQSMKLMRKALMET